MNLMRTSMLSALAVLTKLATSVFLNKILAVYVGPTGYGVIGQLQSLISIATTFASGAVNTGVTKYTAEHAGDAPRQRAVWRTAAALGLMCTALPVVTFLVGHEVPLRATRLPKPRPPSPPPRQPRGRRV